MQRAIPVRVALRLRDAEPAGITTLAHDLGLSRTSIENALAQLSTHDLVVGELGAPRGSGRPARQYRFRSDIGLVAGVDIGVHSIRVVVADLAGRTVATHGATGVDTAEDPSSQLDAVTACLHETLDRLAPTQLRALGVSLPGIVDPTGRLLASVIFPAWVGFDLAEKLGHDFGCPVVIDNGVRLATVAEHHLGAGRGFDDMLYLSVGTRVAAGLIIGGEPRRGAHDVAGDIGRTAFRGLDQRTGQIRWHSAASAKEVFALARQGDRSALAELERFIEELAHGLAGVAMAIDPAIVVVGGGMSLAKEELLDPLRRRLTEHIGPTVTLPVIASRLGEQAAVHGALVAAFRDCAAHIYSVGDLPPPTIIPAN
ncbi:MAG: ROK family protein [Arachnia propionica]|uniref:ROK family transcriptional regulator n=1 Tax=Arachnia propionica TaxID=1750 RepID=UPI00270821A0|nr:ROK family protein [Arachnia propionica]